MYKQHQTHHIWYLMEVSHHGIYDGTRNRGTGRIHNGTGVDNLSTGIWLYHRVSLVSYTFYLDLLFSCFLWLYYLMSHPISPIISREFLNLSYIPHARVCVGRFD